MEKKTRQQKITFSNLDVPSSANDPTYRPLKTNGWNLKITCVEKDDQSSLSPPHCWVQNVSFQGGIWVFPEMVVSPNHPKMIIFSRKTPWLLGTTIFGNIHIDKSRKFLGAKTVISMSFAILQKIHWAPRTC